MSKSNYKGCTAQYYITIDIPLCGGVGGDMDEEWELVTGWENLKKFAKNCCHTWKITEVGRNDKTLLKEGGNPYDGKRIPDIDDCFGKHFWKYRLESHDEDVMKQLQSEAETQ